MVEAFISYGKSYETFVTFVGNYPYLQLVSIDMKTFLLRYWRLLGLISIACSLVNTLFLIGRYRSLSNITTAVSLVFVLAALFGFMLQRRLGTRRAN